MTAQGLFNSGVASEPTQAPAATWRYELNNGVEYVPLPPATPGGRWAVASAFDAQPPACAQCTVSRTWEAPANGVIAVRGWALKNALGGDGVGARVTLNGRKVWPPEASVRTLNGSDRTGWPTRLDDLRVRRGDRLRFELTAGLRGDNRADLTSWSPTVAYTSYDEGGLLLVQDGQRGDGHTQVTYAAGDWTQQGEAHQNLGLDAQARLHVAFTGGQIVVHGVRGPDDGLAAFSICERDTGQCTPESFIDLHARGSEPRRVTWTSPLLPLGSYILVLRATHTKNPASQGY